MMSHFKKATIFCGFFALNNTNMSKKSFQVLLILILD